jgi:hypothetical protein
VDGRRIAAVNRSFEWQRSDTETCCGFKVVGSWPRW